jgi:plasmid stabilization system protein ParE
VNPPILRPAAAADVETVEIIRAFPESGPLVHRGVRRQLLRRFPYGLFYRLIEGQVVVVACFHARRNPRVWRSRT